MRILRDRGLGGDERGATGVFLALGMILLLSAAALAIDLGMLMHRRTEAQRTADGAALAGAASLIYAPGDAAQARTLAKQFAGLNDVGTGMITLRDQDIDVIFPDTVRVRVLRTQGYGGPLSTVFARLFGQSDVDVSTVAAARASQVGAGDVSCLLPVALPDRWNDTFYDSPSVGTLEWEPADGDYYEPPYLVDGVTPNPNYIGYNVMGEQFVLLPAQGGATPGPPPSSRLTPGMWELWLPENDNGVPPIRTRILGCPDGQDSLYQAQDSLFREAGNMQTLADTFREILNDPAYAGQYYDAGCGTFGCVRDASNGNSLVTGGLRYRNVAVFDPSTYTQQGSGPHFVISHFVGVFIDSIDPGPSGQANVYARIMPTVGTTSGSGPAAGPLVWRIQLVQ